MALKLITGPAAEPVTLAEALLHLQGVPVDQETLVAAFIAAAREALEGKDGILGRALATQTWELVLDEFPASPIEIPLPPLQAVESVKYLDAAGVEQTLAPTEYAVDVDSEPGWIVPATSWPATFGTINAVRIRFVAGYAAGKMPAPLRAAVLLHVADLYANRERSGDRQLFESAAYDSLVFPYRIRLLG